MKAAGWGGFEGWEGVLRKYCGSFGFVSDFFGFAFAAAACISV